MTASDADHVQDERRSGGLSPGHIVLGALLILFGIGWLLQATSAIHLRWDIGLSLVLIVIGLALIAGARRGELGWLIGPGIIITVVLSLSLAMQVPLAGGAGDRVVRPTSLSEAQTPYRQAVGDLTLDFRGLMMESGEVQIDASVGMGTLEVLVPEAVAVVLDSHVGAGSVTFVDGRSQGGVGIDRTFTSSNASTATRTLHLNLAVGMGEIEVRQ
jgi:hypothetical protein